jgi:hypothetical protein
MRGDHEEQGPMWSYISPEQRIIDVDAVNASS